MTTNSNTKLRLQKNIVSRNTLHDFRSAGLFAKWPVIGLTMFLLGTLVFGALAYSVSTKGPLAQWDMTTTNALQAAAKNIPPSLVEYVLFGFFVGKELVMTIGTILAIYFLHIRFWRELAMVLIGF